MERLKSLGEGLSWNDPTIPLLVAEEERLRAKNSRQQEEEDRKRAEEEYQARIAAEIKENQKRQKVKEIKKIVKDARIMEMLNQSGLSYHTVYYGLKFDLPYNYQVFFYMDDSAPMVEINHDIAVAKDIRDFLLKYSEWIEKQHLALCIDAKLNKPCGFSKMMCTLPMKHSLVIVYESDQLQALQPTLLNIVKDATDIFVKLAERKLIGSPAFALTQNDLI